MTPSSVHLHPGESPIRPIGEIVHTLQRKLEESQAGPLLTGLQTGFPRLDELTAGFQPRTLVAVTASRSDVLTAFLLKVIDHVAGKQGMPVGILAESMSAEYLVTALACMRSNLDMKTLRSGGLTQEERERFLGVALSEIASLPLVILESRTPLSDTVLTTSSRIMASEHGVGLLITDQGGRPTAPGVAHCLSTTAAGLNLPVVLLSQHDGTAGQHLPDILELADLALSIGMVSQVPGGETRFELARVRVMRNRNGPTGAFDLLFSPETFRLGDVP